MVLLLIGIQYSKYQVNPKVTSKAAEDTKNLMMNQ